MEPLGLITLARKLRVVDYFTLGRGTMVGVGWLVVMWDWLLRGGVLVFEDDRIVCVGRRYEAPVDARIDASHKLVMPGLINVHCHPTIEAGGRLIADVGRRDYFHTGFLNYTAAPPGVLPLDARADRTVRAAGLVTTLLVFALAAAAWLRFAPGVAGLQFEERRMWVPAIGIGYHLGLDGLSVSLVVLTAFLFPLALWVAADQVRDRGKAFVATALLLEAGLLGTFMAQDLVLFYVFWEAMLIPMYFLIALWGGAARVRAAIKFFLFTMAGSVLMLLAIVAVYLQGARVLGAPTFDLPALLSRPLGLGGAEPVLFGAFAVAFAIKMPVWPLHTWLPDAYAEAPPVVTVLLAAVMAKAGAYGLLRFCLPLFPEASRAFGPLLSVLAVIGILYGGAIAWTQRDMRRLLAYGSMSHMGFILLGIFALNAPAVQGSLIQMVNHGVSTGALFLLAGFLFEAHYSMQGAAVNNNKNQSVYQLALDYENAPFRVGYANVVGKPPASSGVSETVRYDNLYGNWDYGKGKVYLAYVRSNNNGPTTGAPGLGAVVVKCRSPPGDFTASRRSRRGCSPPPDLNCRQGRKSPVATLTNRSARRIRQAVPESAPPLRGSGRARRCRACGGEPGQSEPARGRARRARTPRRLRSPRRCRRSPPRAPAPARWCARAADSA